MIRHGESGCFATTPAPFVDALAGLRDALDMVDTLDQTASAHARLGFPHDTLSTATARGLPRSGAPRRHTGRPGH